jgi:1-deoxy-D-xylulose 5-phosphate reductoisomerase
VAVAAFLEERVPLTAIPSAVEAALDHWEARNRPLDDLAQALSADVGARRFTDGWLAKFPSPRLGSG